MQIFILIGCNYYRELFHVSNIIYIYICFVYKTYKNLQFHNIQCHMGIKRTCADIVLIPKNLV